MKNLNALKLSTLFLSLAVCFSAEITTTFKEKKLSNGKLRQTELIMRGDSVVIRVERTKVNGSIVSETRLFFIGKAIVMGQYYRNGDGRLDETVLFDTANDEIQVLVPDKGGNLVPAPDDLFEKRRQEVKEMKKMFSP